MDLAFSEDDHASSSEDSAIDNEMNEMLDMIGHKCSICFVAESETELTICGDQFCYDCLEKYWKVKLEESAWGIRPVKFDCPVCREVITDTNWLRWVGPGIREIYQKMTTQRAQFTRCCQDCGHEQRLLGEPIEESLEDLLETIISEEVKEAARGQILRKLELKDLTSLLRHLGRNLVPEGGKPSAKRIYFLRKLLQMSIDADTGDLFANKQLAAVQCCSGTICDFCAAHICLRCGSNDWHPEVSCLEHIRERISMMRTDDVEYQSLVWKGENGKNCPKCYLLITKDDDGSCNQMRCNYCAYAFCWECQREWSSACGYYQCSLQQQKQDSTTSVADSSSKREKHTKRGPDTDRTEAGIPDVTKLPSFSPR